jgi:hypothetical protein
VRLGEVKLGQARYFAAGPPKYTISKASIFKTSTSKRPTFCPKTSTVYFIDWLKHRLAKTLTGQNIDWLKHRLTKNNLLTIVLLFYSF